MLIIISVLCDFMHLLTELHYKEASRSLTSHFRLSRMDWNVCMNIKYFSSCNDTIRIFFCQCLENISLFSSLTEKLQSIPTAFIAVLGVFSRTEVFVNYFCLWEGLDLNLLENIRESHDFKAFLRIYLKWLFGLIRFCECGLWLLMIRVKFLSCQRE